MELRNRCRPQARKFIQMPNRSISHWHRTAHHHGPAHPHRLEDFGQRFAQVRPRNPNQHHIRPGGIQQWPKKVENGSLPPLRTQFSGGNNVPECRMVFRGKEEGKTVADQKSPHLIRPQIKRNSERLHHIGTAHR